MQIQVTMSHVEWSILLEHTSSTSVFDKDRVGQSLVFYVGFFLKLFLDFHFCSMVLCIFLQLLSIECPMVSSSSFFVHVYIAKFHQRSFSYHDFLDRRVIALTMKVLNQTSIGKVSIMSWLILWNKWLTHRCPWICSNCHSQSSFLFF